MLYRKGQQSDSELEQGDGSESSSEDDESNHSSAKPVILGKVIHQTLKTQFVELVDAYGHEKLGWVQFTWNANGNTNFQAAPDEANSE